MIDSLRYAIKQWLQRERSATYVGREKLFDRQKICVISHACERCQIARYKRWIFFEIPRSNNTYKCPIWVALAENFSDQELDSLFIDILAMVKSKSYGDLG